MAHGMGDALPVRLNALLNIESAESLRVVSKLLGMQLLTFDQVVNWTRVLIIIDAILFTVSASTTCQHE